MWVGGGTVFGPTPRDHSRRVNKKMRKSALRSALADKAIAGRVWILDGFADVKTKAAAEALRSAGIGGRALVVIGDENDPADAAVGRAFRNLRDVAFAVSGSLAAYDVLVADDVVFTRTAFDRLGGAPAPTAEEATSS